MILAQTDANQQCLQRGAYTYEGTLFGKEDKSFLKLYIFDHSIAQKNIVWHL